MVMAEIHEGGCLCGAARYRVTGKPQRVGVCHCTFCQRRTGSAFSIHAFFDEENVDCNWDTLATYEERSDESNLRLSLHYCKICATTIMLTVERFPGMRLITGGTFDDPNWLKVDRHIWTRSAQHWMVFSPDVARFEKGSHGAKVP
jgi:hypothetical protein